MPLTMASQGCRVMARVNMVNDLSTCKPAPVEQQLSGHSMPDSQEFKVFPVTGIKREKISSRAGALVKPLAMGE